MTLYYCTIINSYYYTSPQSLKTLKKTKPDPQNRQSPAKCERDNSPARFSALRQFLNREFPNIGLELEPIGEVSDIFVLISISSTSCSGHMLQFISV